MTTTSISSCSSATYAIQDDLAIRRRLQAELNAIKDVMPEAETDNAIVHCIKIWQREFESSLGHSDPTFVIPRFIETLERILEDPVRPGTYSSYIFSSNAPRIVQLLISKMQNEKSVLFSSRISDAAKKKIDLTQINKTKEAWLSSMRDRLIERGKEQKAMQASVDSDIQRLVNLGQEIQNSRLEAERFNSIVSKLEQELQEHDRAIQELNVQLRTLEGDINVLRRNNLELEKRIQEVDKAIKQQKNNWMMAVGIAVLSIAVTWGASSLISGANVMATQSSIRAGIVIVF